MVKQKTLAMLRSDRVGDRYEGWIQLQAECAVEEVSPELFRRLHERVVNEQEDGVWRMGVNVLLGLCVPRPADTLPVESPATVSDPLSLSDWFWTPFKSQSVVLGLSDPNYRRRDAGALIMLARHLGHRDFPKTRFHPIQMKDPDFEPLLAQDPPESMLFVGRLGLYGEYALKHWSESDLRFGFLIHERPKAGPPPGQLDPRYHCIYEKLDGRKKELYPTTQEKKKRTDFALIQRYAVMHAGGHMVVVTCAGASSVGTLAAAQWLADILPRPHPLKDRIPLPDGVGPESRLEALLRVTSDADASAWALAGIEVCKLYVDDLEWSGETRTWRKRAFHSVTIETEGNDPKMPVAVVAGRSRTTLESGSMTGRLLMAIFLQTGGKKSAVVDLEALARDTWIWGNKTKTVRQIRKWLTWLRNRHLSDVLVIEKEIWLKANLVLQQQDKSAGGKPSQGETPRARRKRQGPAGGSQKRIG